MYYKCLLLFKAPQTINQPQLHQLYQSSAEAEEGGHRRKRRARSYGAAAPHASAAKHGLGTTASPDDAPGTARRTARAVPTPKPEIKAVRKLSLGSRQCRLAKLWSFAIRRYCTGGLSSAGPAVFKSRHFCDGLRVRVAKENMCC